MLGLKTKVGRIYLYCTPCEKTVMLCFRAQVYNNNHFPTFQMGQKPEEGSDVTATIELSKALGNVTIVRKGPSDVICMGDKGRS